MKGNSLALVTNGLIFLCLTSHCFALDFDFGLSGNSRTTDNAPIINQAAATEALSERQDVLSFNASAAHAGDRVNLSANYSVSQNNFSEDSQPDRGTQSGRSSLNLGRESDIVQLLLEHSAQLVLGNPDDLETLGNLNERNITTAQPSLNFRMSDVDGLSIIGVFQNISYDEQPDRDSSREGLRVQWDHRFSSISMFSLLASQEDVDFDALPFFSYKQNYIELAYSAALRNLTYTVAVGQDKSTRDGEELYSGGRYRFDMNYDLGNSVVGVRLSNNLTDNSRGDGNQASLSGDEEINQGSFRDADQIELTSEEIYFNSSMICARCTLSLSLSRVEESYTESNEFDNVRSNFSATLGYQINTFNNISLSYRDSDREFMQLSNRDFQLTRSTMMYRYALSRDLDLNAFVERQDRTNTLNSAIDRTENQYGLGFGYRF